MKAGKKLPGAVLSLLVLFAGCSGSPVQPAPGSAHAEVFVMAADTPLPEAPVVADPKGAVEEIYSGLPDCISENINVDRLKEIIGIMDLNTNEVFARYSDPKGGVSDIVIAKPAKGSEVEVREALYRYIDRRVSEFENYDVLGSLETAQNAIIFEQGEYIVLLMFKDNEAAREIIDRYIPL